MKPAPGRYRLDYAPGMAMEVTITEDSMLTPFGEFEYIPPPPPGDLYLRSDKDEYLFAVRFDDAVNYSAVYGNNNYQGTYVRMP